MGFKLAGELGQLVGKASKGILSLETTRQLETACTAQGFLEFSPLPWAPCQQSA